MLLKRRIFLCVMLFAAQTISAQQIRIVIKNSPDTLAKVNYPVGPVNYPYWENGQAYFISQNRSLEISNTLQTAQTVLISNNNKIDRFFLVPGKPYDIHIDYAEKNRILKVKGADAEGMVLYNQLDHPFYHAKASTYMKKDSTAVGVFKLLSAERNAELRSFEQLKKIGKISADFYKWAATDIRYYYAAVSGAVCLQQFARTTYNTKHPSYRKSFSPDFEKAWPLVFNIYPLHEEAAMAAPDFFFYARDYISAYQQVYKKTKKGDYEKSADDEQYLRDYYGGFKQFFEGKTLEYLLARHIFDEAMEKRYQKTLINLYDQFTTDYPKSIYTVYLSPLIREIKSYHQGATLAFKEDQHLLEGGQISSFQQLTDLYKGRMVYVDIWATWCGPCKAQFEYNYTLKPFLKKHQIEMLYISMDAEKDEQKWKDMIKYYDLSGSHIRTNEQLKKDLMNIFWDGESYGIPRYLIVKDGVLLEKQALQPGDGEKLFKQFAGHL